MTCLGIGETGGHGISDAFNTHQQPNALAVGLGQSFPSFSPHYSKISNMHAGHFQSDITMAALTTTKPEPHRNSFPHSASASAAIPLRSRLGRALQSIEKLYCSRSVPDQNVVRDHEEASISSSRRTLSSRTMHLKRSSRSSNYSINAQKVSFHRCDCNQSFPQESVRSSVESTHALGIAAAAEELATQDGQ